MSVFDVTRDQVETFTMVATPSRSFVTSSLGATGSVYVFARRSGAEKDVEEAGTDIAPFGDSDLRTAQLAIANKLSSSTNISNEASTYLQAVHSRPVRPASQVALPVFRYVPTNDFTENTLRKNVVRKHLMPFYRPDMPSANWAYTNYNCVSFFTSSQVPTGSVLLYPNFYKSPNGFSTYRPTGAISFDFYVNPRYRAGGPSLDFRAATLVHLSSSYAVSLVSGSGRDESGRTSGYRIQLQLSHSADISPSNALQGAYPSDLVFLSDDNALQWNTWHHVVVRWGGSGVNSGTGSFVVDGRARGTFVVPSGSLGALPTTPSALCVGNYYEGSNSGTSQQAYFFSTNPSLRDGLPQLIADTSRDQPATFTFKHPFNADFHDLAVVAGYVTDDQIASGSGTGPAQLPSNVLFYLPPFFTHESPYRKSVSGLGGVLQTPFFSTDGTTTDPFNVDLAFGVGGHSINIENFLMDFATGQWPRAFNLSMSVVASTTNTARSANDFTYDVPDAIRRNLLVMPCDDGKFVPNFDLLSTASAWKYIDDLGSADASLVSLNGLLPSSSYYAYVTDQSGSVFSLLAGPTPESTNGVAGDVLTIFQRTRDDSSNQVTFFDISNLYYGLRVLPGTFCISDPSVSGSNGALSITLRDDGKGNLFRADCKPPHASWSTVGNIFYNEGVVVVKSPHLQFFGKDGFSLSFKGEQTVHTLRVNVLAEANTLNSSSNASYTPVSASYSANETDPKFVYISDVYLMDRDMNVVAKAALAQPIMKRSGDRLMLRIRHDF